MALTGVALSNDGDASPRWPDDPLVMEGAKVLTNATAGAFLSLDLQVHVHFRLSRGTKRPQPGSPTNSPSRTMTRPRLST